MRIIKMPLAAVAFLEAAGCIVYSALIVLIFSLIPLFSLFWYLVFCPATIVFLTYSFIYIPVYYKIYRIYVTHSDVVFESGVFSKKIRYLKREHVVYHTMYRTFFTPFFGIVSLRMCAAGSRVLIPYISLADADEIVDKLNGVV